MDGNRAQHVSIVEPCRTSRFLVITFRVERDIRQVSARFSRAGYHGGGLPAMAGWYSRCKTGQQAPALRKDLIDGINMLSQHAPVLQRAGAVPSRVRRGVRSRPRIRAWAACQRYARRQSGFSFPASSTTPRRIYEQRSGPGSTSGRDFDFPTWTPGVQIVNEKIDANAKKYPVELHGDGPGSS